MTCNKLRRQLSELKMSLCELIRELPVKYVDWHRHPNVFVVAPNYYWGEKDPNQTNIQIKLKRQYDAVSELLFLFFKAAPKEISRQLKEADKSIRKWIELGDNWAITPDKEANETNLKKDFFSLEQIVEILESDSNKEIILIPDTNSLLISSDPVSYKNIASSDNFTFLLMPTVLAELDELKILHRNPDVRDKAKNTIKRIKGWRNQGSLTEGVKVNRTIRVIAEHKEPDMQNTLSWLVPENRDDRIVANVLSIEMSYPASRVVLVTGDINLQNKADSAMIEVNELEEA